MMSTKEIRAASNEWLIREETWNNKCILELEQDLDKPEKPGVSTCDLLYKRRTYSQLLMAEFARRNLD